MQRIKLTPSTIRQRFQVMVCWIELIFYIDKKLILFNWSHKILSLLSFDKNEMKDLLFVNIVPFITDSSFRSPKPEATMSMI